MTPAQVIALIAGMLAAADETYRSDSFPTACVSDAERIYREALQQGYASEEPADGHADGDWPDDDDYEGFADEEEPDRDR